MGRPSKGLNLPSNSRTGTFGKFLKKPKKSQRKDPNAPKNPVSS
eukprot:SAG31_NODE_14674_length_793_cov_1.347262_1_plen_43_part_01